MTEQVAFVVRDAAQRAAVLCISSTSLERFPFIDRLFAYNNANKSQAVADAVDSEPKPVGKLRPTNNTVELWGKIMPVVAIEQKIALLELLRHVSLPLELTNFFHVQVLRNEDSLDSVLFVETSPKQARIDCNAVLEWLALLEFFSCDTDTKEQFVKTVFTKLLDVPSEILLQQVVQHVFASDLFASLLRQHSMAPVLDQLVDNCVARLTPQKEQTASQAAARFQKKIVAPLFALLQEWHEAAQHSLTLASIASTLFCFSRRFWVQNPVLRSAPDVQLAVQMLPGDKLRVSLQNVADAEITVANGRVDCTDPFLQWHQWIASQDRFKLYEKKGNVVQRNAKWEADWLYPPVLGNNEAAFTLPPCMFCESDPIDDKIWQLFDGTPYRLWVSGGTVSRALRRRRYLEDEICDIDLYVLCGVGSTDATLQALCEQLAHYFERKSGNSTYAFKRGNVFTIFCNGAELPLQLTFLRLPEISNVYSRFDLSHVHAAFSLQAVQQRPLPETQQRQSVWCASVHGWVTNIYGCSTFLMISKDWACISAARVAKAFHVQLSLANHAYLGRCDVLCSRVGTTDCPFDDAAPSALHYLRGWRSRLNAAGGGKRKCAESVFFARVTRRFSINCRGYEKQHPKGWLSPHPLAEVLLHQVIHTECGSGDYGIDDFTPSETDFLNGSIVNIAPIGLANVYFMPIFRRPEWSNAGYIFGTSVALRLMQTWVRETKPQRLGLYKNYVFARARYDRVDDWTTGQIFDKFEPSANGQVFIADVVLSRKNEEQLAIDAIVLKKRVTVSSLIVATPAPGIERSE